MTLQKITTRNLQSLNTGVKTFFLLWLGPLVTLAAMNVLLGNSEYLFYWKSNLFLTVFFMISAFTNGFFVPFLSKYFSILKAVFMSACLVLAISFLFDVVYSFRIYTSNKIQVSAIRSILNVSIFVLGYLLVKLFSRPKNEEYFEFPRSKSFLKKVACWIVLPQGALIGFILAAESLYRSSSLDLLLYVLGSFGYSIAITAAAILALFSLTKFSFFRSEIAVLVAVTTLVCILAGMTYGLSTLARLTLATALVTSVFPGFFSAIGVIFLLLQHNSNLAKDRKFKLLDLTYRKNDSEFRNLKQQTNPHFFFNNLNMLISFIESDPQKAVIFGKQLANVYRKFLRNEDSDFVSVEDEMAFILEYLEIYKAKFGNAVSISINVEPGGSYLRIHFKRS